MLLAIDTATTTASLALYDLAEERLLAEWTWEARRRQTQDLLNAAATLLAQAACHPRDLTALAVTTGPGSFTGVRIGISTVKGMALGLPGMPRIVGIPTLRVTAEPWLQAAGSGRAGTTIWALLAAGRGRYNWLTCTPPEHRLRPTVADHSAGPAAALATALAEHGSQPVWLVGEVDLALREQLRHLPHVTVLDAVSGWRRAGSLAGLAARALAACEDEPLATLEPLYLRQPGA